MGARDRTRKRNPKWMMGARGIHQKKNPQIEELGKSFFLFLRTFLHVFQYYW